MTQLNYNVFNICINKLFYLFQIMEDKKSSLDITTCSDKPDIPTCSDKDNYDIQLLIKQKFQNFTWLDEISKKWLLDIAAAYMRGDIIQTERSYNINDDDLKQMIYVVSNLSFFYRLYIYSDNESDIIKTIIALKALTIISPSKLV